MNEFFPKQTKEEETTPTPYPSSERNFEEIIEESLDQYDEYDDGFYDEDDRYEYDDEYDDEDDFDEYFDDSDLYEDLYYEELNASYRDDNFICQRDWNCPYNCGSCDGCDYEGECTMCERDGSSYCDTCIHRDTDY